MPRVPVLFAVVLALVVAGSAQAQTGPSPVLLGTADSFAVLGGSAITNTGSTVLNGDLGLHPGTAVTGFPPGTVNGAVHVNDAVAEQAKADLVTAYNDAAGRPRTATASPDIGGQTLTPGVYRTGSVASLGLTGTLTLDAQGDPSAVFIFQIESTLTTATDSRVTIINGGQACNVFWQVGSSATLGTRTAFQGTILALTSISAANGVTIGGGFMARNGAVTLDTDTVTRSQCAVGTEPPGTEPPGEEPPGTEGPGTEGPDRVDDTPPRVRIFGPPGRLGPPSRPPGAGECTKRNFTVKIRLRDRSGIRRVSVYIDGRRVKRVSRRRVSLRVKVRGLRVGRHRIKVVAIDREGNRAVRKRSFRRCALEAAAPQFTG